MTRVLPVEVGIDGAQSEVQRMMENEGKMKELTGELCNAQREASNSWTFGCVLSIHS